LLRRGFTSEFFLLHHQSGFKVFHLVGVELPLVRPLYAAFPGMGNPTGDVYLQPV